MFKGVTAKLGNMRKPQEFVVYPMKAGDTHITIQSDGRIARFEITTGKGLISSGKGGHQGYVMLNPLLGAMEITVSQEFIQECLGSKPPANAAGQVTLSSLIGGHRHESADQVVPPVAIEYQGAEVGAARSAAGQA